MQIGKRRKPDKVFPGPIAQLGERHNGIVEVSGSIPLGSTNSKAPRCKTRRFCFCKTIAASSSPHRGTVQSGLQEHETIIAPEHLIAETESRDAEDAACDRLFDQPIMAHRSCRFI